MLLENFYNNKSHEVNSSGEIRAGLLSGLVASSAFYPDYPINGIGKYENLTQTFGDSVERTIWRTRQGLDKVSVTC